MGLRGFRAAPRDGEGSIPLSTTEDAGRESTAGSSLPAGPDALRAFIEAEVGSWPGVSTRPHRFGGVEFRYGRVELGHLHGGRLADLPMPRTVRDELVAAGRALPHHVLPESGWVSRPIRGPEDAKDAIGLFRLNYERVVTRRGGAATR